MKTKCWFFTSIAAILLTSAIWFNCSYTVIAGQIYNRDVVSLNLSDSNLKNPRNIAKLEHLQVADLRNTGLTPEQYDQLRTALPNCEILWLVPFQGDYLDPDMTSLTISSITEEEMSLLAYLPKLQTIDMTACTDVDAILKVKDLYPQCEIQWMVPFQGKSISYDVLQIVVSVLTEEDIAALRHFPNLQSVNARKCPDLDAIMELVRQYPALEVSWLVPIGAGSFAGDSVELEVPGTSIQHLMSQLKYFPQLKTVTISDTISNKDTMLQLQDAYPTVEFSWNFLLCGVTVNSSVNELDLSEIPMESVDEVENNLKYFNNLEKVIMYKCGISSEDMDALWKRHPDIRFVWGAYIGGKYLRTDETTFMPFKLGYTRGIIGPMTNKEAVELKYMVDLVVIDMGHQRLNDLTFLYYMPNLEYLLMCGSAISDLSPVASLKKLKFLEIWRNPITDLSPLAECTALEDINMFDISIADLSPLYDLNLKNLWYSAGRYSSEQRAALREALPDCNIQGGGSHPTDLDWRKLPNNMK